MMLSTNIRLCFGAMRNVGRQNHIGNAKRNDRADQAEEKKKKKNNKIFFQDFQKINSEIQKFSAERERKRGEEGKMGAG